MEDQLGTLVPGRYADILVLARNPPQNARSLRALERVYRTGMAPDPQAILAGDPARDMSDLGMA